MNSKILRRIIQIELYSTVERHHFGGHSRGISALSHVEVVEVYILERELGLGGSADEPEEEDEDDEEDNAGEEDKEDGVNRGGFASLVEVRLFFFNDILGSPSLA